MYAYYMQAAVCYAYLNDVDSLADLPNSSWFTRGWTLQELLAPPVIVFLNRDWTISINKKKLAHKLESITGIPRQALRSFDPTRYRIAEKFSWSVRRKTTRAEDAAYCLLGIFEVNMPLLYGESDRAFMRLQEEIMRVSTDMSIFAWQGTSNDRFGMLATSPSCFHSIPTSLKGPDCTVWLSHRSGWSVDNAGLVMEAVIYPYLRTANRPELYLLDLFHGQSDKAYGTLIPLVKEAVKDGLPTFTRAVIGRTAWLTTDHRYEHSHRPIRLRLRRQPVIQYEIRHEELLVAGLGFESSTHTKSSKAKL